jgi:transposase
LEASHCSCCSFQSSPGRHGFSSCPVIVAAIGNGAAFRKGREFSAWMGLVPKQYSTGGNAKLAGISKRGNLYLRNILIHGARAVVLQAGADRDGFMVDGS